MRAVVLLVALLACLLTPPALAGASGMRAGPDERQDAPLPEPKGGEDAGGKASGQAPPQTQADERAETARPAPVVLDGVPGLIAGAAARWGLDVELMLRIGWCESKWNAGARGPADLAGVFQISPETWRWASTAAGFGGASPYDAKANVEVAAWMMETQGIEHWGCQ